MKSLVRCKSCGFIMDAEKVEDVCPACGVPSKMFEAFTDNISEKRKWILDRHLHPIVVHAPQALGAFLFLFSLCLTFIPWTLRGELFTTIKVMAFCLPFTLVAAILSGLLDAKVRFRRYTTPILKKKIVLGVVFFGCSLAMLFLTQAAREPEGLVYIAAMIGFNGLGFLSGVFLGIYGSSLLQARFPG